MTLGLYYHTQRHIMANLITNVSVEELTETYNSDVSYLGVPTFASNNRYDNCDTNCDMNFCNYIMAMMYNWFNIGLLSLTKMRYTFVFFAIFILHLNARNYLDIDVNENYVFLGLYVIDVRRKLKAEIAEALSVAVVYFAFAGVNNPVDSAAYSVLYFISMSGHGPIF